MSAEERRKYFEMLELTPDASLAEVKSAYMQLREVYSTNSIVMFAIEDEFPESSRREVMQQLEIVYKKLLQLFEDEKRDVVEEKKSVALQNGAVKSCLEGITAFSGGALRQIRESRGIELHDVAVATKIRKGYLSDIEQENYPTLPTEIYLKGYLANYAQYLAVDPKKVTDDYMGRYREWQSLNKKSL